MTAPRQTATSPAGVWDETAALTAVGGDRRLALEMIGDLIASLPLELETLRQLMDEGQLADLAEKAHQCKGGAAYCGVPTLVAALADLDRSARTGNRPRSMQALSAVVAAAADLQTLNLDALTR